MSTIPTRSGPGWCSTEGLGQKQLTLQADGPDLRVSASASMLPLAFAEYAKVHLVKRTSLGEQVVWEGSAFREPGSLASFRYHDRIPRHALGPDDVGRMRVHALFVATGLLVETCSVKLWL
jgi:hypothetical protein